MWKQWVNVVLGLLVVIAAYMQTPANWMIAVFGILVVVVALWAAMEKKPGA